MVRWWYMNQGYRGEMNIVMKHIPDRAGHIIFRLPPTVMYLVLYAHYSRTLCYSVCIGMIYLYWLYKRNNWWLDDGIWIRAIVARWISLWRIYPIGRSYYIPLATSSHIPGFVCVLAEQLMLYSVRICIGMILTEDYKRNKWLLDDGIWISAIVAR